MARRLRPLLSQALTLSVAAICAVGCGTATAAGSAARGSAARTSSAGGGNGAPAGSGSRAAALRGAPMILARCPVVGGGSPPAGSPAPKRSVRPFAPGAGASGRATAEPLRTLPAASASRPAGPTGAVTPIAVSRGTLSRVGSAERGAARIHAAWCEPVAGRCPPGYRSVYRKTLPGSKPRSLLPNIAVCALAPPAVAGAGRVGG